MYVCVWVRAYTLRGKCNAETTKKAPRKYITQEFKIINNEGRNGVKSLLASWRRRRKETKKFEGSV